MQETSFFFYFVCLLTKSSSKFISIQTGVFYWSTVQTLNYTFISERNRVPMISLFGLAWTTYLAYVKQKSPSIIHSTAKLPDITTAAIAS